ncbi:hypothetical protein KKG48_02345 [Patescibacteria group bacterium]|nr:hypothetical protein [Patescibacteria group bacterium]MCG2695075.1 hypothetical protein [Candidatus Parcubacteria bacterium]
MERTRVIKIVLGIAVLIIGAIILSSKTKEDREFGIMATTVGFLLIASGIDFPETKKILFSSPQEEDD